MMAGTLSDQVLEAHRVDDSSDAEHVLVRVDAVLGHDATIALMVHEFRKRNLTIWDKSRAIFVNDHFSPAASVERANISRLFIGFAREQGVESLHIDKGICHQILVEHALCAPGALIVGADSHTVMGGALGACCTGMGTTDILFTLATGTTWLRRPETIKVEFSGKLRAECSGRDVILAILGRLGEDGARYRTLEFHDHSEGGIPQDDRFAISNMVVECGAKFGVFVPDQITAEYCAQRDGKSLTTLPAPSPDASYESSLTLDLSDLGPLVARPYSPANVSQISEVEGTKISHAFLGSCSSGRLEDLRIAAEVVQGKAVHPEVRFVIIPASQGVFKAALRLGYVEVLTEAGAVFNQTSCGPCGGIDKGLLGADDVCVSTSSRNFRGRMGDVQSQTFLASARTVAHAALSGRLVNYV
ncbi:MAG TPA: aconitase/3-isopropylmalate dehydratase large subunit family protein [Polyangiaceae bacterium]|jgi:3-isopropylmalate dehydratase large subunit|nr:aconitase/3-isopropylmalate dehydratase large subunit family protein [Polyangiaceae bacterium]